MVCYLHEVPGRLRIKIPRIKRNAQKAEELRNLLHSVAGVKSTSVSVVTGSAVIQFDCDLVRSETILNLLVNDNYIDLRKAMTSQQYVEKALSNAGKTVSKALLGLALDKALQGSSLSIIAAFI